MVYKPADAHFMSLIHAIERSVSAKRASVINKATRARKKIMYMRTRGLYDPILGLIPDRRDPPSILTIAIEQHLRKLNRSIARIVEWKRTSESP